MASEKSLLDLIPSGPIYSLPFVFQGQAVKWRLLDGLETQGCRIAAQRLTMGILVQEMGLEPKEAFALLQAGTSADTEREWLEYHIIGAAMTAEGGGPISMDAPDDIARRLAGEITPIARGRLIEDYIQFAEEHDPTTLSEDDYEEIIAAAGKTESASTWKLYGSNALRSLLAITVPRLIVAETALAEIQEIEDMESRVVALELAISQTSRSLDGSG